MRIKKSEIMSLDVELVYQITASDDNGETFIPGKEIAFEWSGLTHNLSEMAEAAGIYEAIWRPYMLHPEFPKKGFNDIRDEWKFEDTHIMYAADIIPVLERGFAKLAGDPDYYIKFNATNGWGSYDGFLRFVESYLQACKRHPSAVVKVGR